MSDNERTTITREPADRVVVERSGSSAGWWVAALVAVIALIGVIFLVNNSSTGQDALQAARDQGATEANLANAATGAQTAAASAATAAQDAASGAARATESAAQAAASRSAQAVDATADAARDASSTEPDQPR